MRIAPAKCISWYSSPILVANAGGSTTPLGDPPLFIGYLLGVPFLWPVQHLTAPLAVLALPLLFTFYIADRYIATFDPDAAATRTAAPERHGERPVHRHRRGDRVAHRHLESGGRCRCWARR